MNPPALVNRTEKTHDSDAAVRQTDTDAALARLSAVKKGYLNDRFVSSMVPRAQLQPLRPPLINIGTYMRSEAIDRLVEQWLELSKRERQRCQIISLGAGSDTRFWRLMVIDDLIPLRWADGKIASRKDLGKSRLEHILSSTSRM